MNEEPAIAIFTNKCKLLKVINETSILNRGSIFVLGR